MATKSRIFVLRSRIACVFTTVFIAAVAPCNAQSQGDMSHKPSAKQRLSLMESRPLVPAFFAIGDSLLDAGNNNFLVTVAKANFPPYGRQFDTGRPTGRFCNGRTAIDFLAAYLGLPLLKPYLDPTFRGNSGAASLLRGVNFGSSGSGILDDTGNVFGQHISLSQQIKLFQEARDKIFSLIGSDQGTDILSRSIFYVLTGNNDYINNYLLVPTRSTQYTPSAYQELLVSTFKAQLTDLYGLGARKIVVSGLPPLGCVPSQLVKFGSKGPCVDFVNNLAINYNQALQSMLKDMRNSFKDATFVYNNLYDIAIRGILNPPTLGFQFGNVACCGIGPYGGGSPCLPATPVCEDYRKHLFWDEFHPSEQFNSIITRKLFNGTSGDSYPVNIMQLAKGLKA